MILVIINIWYSEIIIWLQVYESTLVGTKLTKADPRRSTVNWNKVEMSGLRGKGMRCFYKSCLPQYWRCNLHGREGCALLGHPISILDHTAKFIDAIEKLLLRWYITRIFTNHNNTKLGFGDHENGTEALPNHKGGQISYLKLKCWFRSFFAHNSDR